MRSIVLENKTGVWILRTCSQPEFGQHIGEFEHWQCDTLGSCTGRITANPKLIPFSSVYDKSEADHPLSDRFTDAMLRQVTPS